MLPRLRLAALAGMGESQGLRRLRSLMRDVLGGRIESIREVVLVGVRNSLPHLTEQREDSRRVRSAGAWRG